MVMLCLMLPAEAYGQPEHRATAMLVAAARLSDSWQQCYLANMANHSGLWAMQ